MTQKGAKKMTLNDAELGKEYVIFDVETDDFELVSFLLSLGCYKGGKVAVISRRKKSCVIALKDSRYTIDTDLAGAILIEK